jgi:hypothetical protein
MRERWRVDLWEERSPNLLQREIPDLTRLNSAITAIWNPNFVFWRFLRCVWKWETKWCYCSEEVYVAENWNLSTWRVNKYFPYYCFIRFYLFLTLLGLELSSPKLKGKINKIYMFILYILLDKNILHRSQLFICVTCF